MSKKVLVAILVIGIATAAVGLGVHVFHKDAYADTGRVISVLVDDVGEPGVWVRFTINGVDFDRQTNEFGWFLLMAPAAANWTAKMIDSRYTFDTGNPVNSNPAPMGWNDTMEQFTVEVIDD